MNVHQAPSRLAIEANLLILAILAIAGLPAQATPPRLDLPGTESKRRVAPAGPEAQVQEATSLPLPEALGNLVGDYLGEPHLGGLPRYPRSAALPFFDYANKPFVPEGKGPLATVVICHHERYVQYPEPKAFRCAGQGQPFPFPCPEGGAPDVHDLFTFTNTLAKGPAAYELLQAPGGASFMEVVFGQGASNSFIHERLEREADPHALASFRKTYYFDVRGLAQRAGVPGEASLLDGPALGTARCLNPMALCWVHGQRAERITSYLAFTEPEGRSIRLLDEKNRVVTLCGSSTEPAAVVDGLAPVARFKRPTYLASCSYGVLPGALWVSDSDGNAIRRVATATGSVTTLTREVLNPQGLYALANGSVLVADQGHHVLRLVRPDGTSQVFAGRLDEDWRGPGDVDRFHDLKGLAVLSRLYPSGVEVLERVLVIDGHALRILDRTERGWVVQAQVGSITEKGFRDGPACAMAGTPSFHQPHGLVCLDGLVFLTDTGNHAIRVVDLNNDRLATPGA